MRLSLYLRLRAVAHLRMKVAAMVSACAFLLGGPLDAQAAVIQVFESDPGLPAQAIPDGAFNYSYAPLTVATGVIEVGSLDADLIQSLKVTVNITHPSIGDLVIALEAPNGTMIYLANRPGLPLGMGFEDVGMAGGYTSQGMHASFAITFDDFAASGVSSKLMGEGLGFGQIVGDPGNGSPDNFQPNSDGAGFSSLALLNGLSAEGTWKIYVGDAAPGGAGTLASWSIELTAIPEPAALVLLGGLAGGLLLRPRRSAAH